jgi:hypothetical protein
VLGWPHSSVLLVLTSANVILAAAAFFSRPFGSVPALYGSGSNAFGSYIGLLAAVVALGGAVAATVGRSRRAPVPREANIRLS